MGEPSPEPDAARHGEHPRKPLSPLALAAPVVAVVLFALLAVSFLVPGWIDDWTADVSSPEGAARVQAQAAAWQLVVAVAQAIFAVVLLLVTIFAAVRSHEMTEATKIMADVASEERRDAVMPLAVIRLVHPDRDDVLPAVDAFAVQVTNGGLGPALDLAVGIDDCPLRYVRIVPPELPISLPVGGEVEVEFELDQRDPFADAAGSERHRWPPRMRQGRRSWRFSEDRGCPETWTSSGGPLDRVSTSNA